MPDAAASSTTDPGSPGRQRIGKYHLLGRAGRGGMGSVYRAYDPILDRLVALKVISASLDLTDELRTRFFNEAQACARLTHPNIVTIYDLGESDGQLFIVMELLDGEELNQIIARRSVMRLPDRLSLMIQLCEGLEYAHGRGILHRDIKPSNVFVQRNGGLKLLDFGVARIEALETPVTRTGLLMGTLQYMAPERVRSRGDLRSDIFSVGAVLYEFLTYRAAFAGADAIEILDKIRGSDPVPPSEIDPRLPSTLDAVVSTALEKDPARRFASLRDMSALLRAIREQVAEVSEAEPDETGEAADPEEHLRQLRETVLARIGQTDTSSVALASTGSLRTEIHRFQALLSRADTVQPMLDDGLAAMVQGDYSTAVSRLAWVVREMPEHARAAASLTEARRRAQETRPDAKPLTPATGTTAPQTGAPPVDEGTTIFAPTPPPRPLQAPTWPDRVRTVRGALARATAMAASAVARSLAQARLAQRVGRRQMVVALGGLALIAVVVGATWSHFSARDATRTAELRKLVAAARESAVQAEAPVLAAATYSAATAKAEEAEDVARRGDSARAESLLREATQGYDTATRSAQPVREKRAGADKVRQEMLAAKQSGTAAESALQHEQQGDAEYQKQDFDGAARSFSAAREIYAKPAPPPATAEASAASSPPPVVASPPPAVASPKEPAAPRTASKTPEPKPATRTSDADVRARMADYAKAIETKNLKLLRQVRPGLDEGEVRRWERAFEMTRSRKVDLRLSEVTVEGEQARVVGRRIDVLVLNDGQKIQTDTRFVCRLVHRRDGWVIQEFRESKDG